MRGLTGFDRGAAHIVRKDGKWDPDDPVLTEKRYYEKGEKPPEGYKLEHRYGEYETLEQYCKREDVLIITASEIDPKMVKGELEEQGYIWV